MSASHVKRNTTPHYTCEGKREGNKKEENNFLERNPAGTGGDTTDASCAHWPLHFSLPFFRKQLLRTRISKGFVYGVLNITADEPTKSPVARRTPGVLEGRKIDDNKLP